MEILAKLIYRFNAMPIKILMFLGGVWQTASKICIETQRSSHRPRAPEE
jgi:hypothetical protein